MRGSNGNGDDAMRVEPTMAMDSSTIPMEDFQRSYQLRMPGVKHAKPKEKDPLASLLNAVLTDADGSASSNNGSPASQYRRPLRHREDP